VTVIQWHPTQSGTLAFGTDDGRVGIYNTMNAQHQLLPTGHRNGAVWSLSWRLERERVSEPPSVTAVAATDEEQQPSSVESNPPTSGSASGASKKRKKREQSSEWRSTLYSCGGDGTILAADLQQLQQAQVLYRYADIRMAASAAVERNQEQVRDVTEGISMHLTNHVAISLQRCTDIAWNPTRPVVAIGYRDGRVEFYQSLTAVVREGEDLVAQGDGNDDPVAAGKGGKAAGASSARRLRLQEITVQAAQSRTVNRLLWNPHKVQGSKTTELARSKADDDAACGAGIRMRAVVGSGVRRRKHLRVRALEWARERARERRQPRGRRGIDQGRDVARPSGGRHVVVLVATQQGATA